MTIKKVKLTDGGDSGLTVIFVERPQGRKERKTTQEDQTPVHADLKQAFANIAIHLAILTGYVSVKQVKTIETPKPELFDGFHVSGISVKTGDDPGVVISGHRILENGKAVILNTPFTRFEEGEESAYKFVDDLVARIERVEDEANEYLEDRKKGDDPQGSLFTDTGENELKAPQNTDVEDLQEGAGEVWENGQRPNV